MMRNAERTNLNVDGQAADHGHGSALSLSGDAALVRLAEIAEDFSAEHIAGDARSVAERVAEGRFYVACVGQFKRGKSTLLNALISDTILPTGVVPITTVPTIIRYGEKRSARIRFRNDAWVTTPPETLDEYISEEKNPENAKGVTGLEIFVPSPLLASGMCLVDTPGLGSVFAGNTASTRAFIPHIDAAIVVIGADPPIAGDELALAETVAQQVHELIFVLNKADRVNAQERATAAAFARRVLEKRLGHEVNALYEVSALKHIERQASDDDWAELVAALKTLVEQAGSTLVREATERALRRIGELLLRIVAEERAALERPVEESERRILALRKTISEAEQSMRELGYLLTAEQHHLSDLLGDRRRAFVNQVLPISLQELEQRVQRIPRGAGPAFRRQAMQAAQQVARAHLLPWLKSEEAFAETAFRKTGQRFVDFGNDFLKRLAATGVPELAEVPHALDSRQGFRTRSQFYFYELQEIAAPASPLRLVADLVLGLLGAYGPIVRDANNFLEHLLATNSSRVRGDVDKRVLDSRSRLEADIRILLREVTAMAERALNRARKAQTEGASAVNAALVRLSSATAEIRELCPTIDSGCDEINSQEPPSA
jgi:GTPase Era involved in 16S rRNA processing